MKRTMEAEVIRVDAPDRVVVRLAQGCGEEDTAGCGGCGGCGACGGAGGGPREVPVMTENPLTVGDRVEVEVDFPNAATAALWTFGMPLLLAVAGGGVAHALWPLVELAPAYGGAAGLLAGFLLLMGVDRSALRRGTRIRIVRVLSS